MLVRYSPYSMEGTPDRPVGDSASTAVGAAWTPAVDVYEDGERFVLQADLPGVEAGDFDLHLENRVLTLRGVRKVPKGLEGRGFQRGERQYGRFVRAFTLPANVEQEQIGAAFREGILTVTLPKSDRFKPRRIEVAGG
jgi:HSP20 family protein